MIDIGLVRSGAHITGIGPCKKKTSCILSLEWMMSTNERTANKKDHPTHPSRRETSFLSSSSPSSISSSTAAATSAAYCACKLCNQALFCVFKENSGLFETTSEDPYCTLTGVVAKKSIFWVRYLLVQDIWIVALLL